MQHIEYSPSLDIRNTQFLAPGLGLRYLECIPSHEPGVLIAARWYRNAPKMPTFPSSVLVVFSGEVK